MDRASAAETLDSGSIPGRVKLRLKVDIHNFPTWRLAIKGTVWSLRRVRDGQVAAWLVSCPWRLSESKNLTIHNERCNSQDCERLQFFAGNS